MCTKQQRIAELARRMPDAGFTSLAYYIDLEWMYESYRRTRKDGAAGVEVKPRLNGEAKLVRFADDYVILLTSREDALRVQAVLPKRFGRYGLKLHDEKTRLVDFRRPRRNRHRSETFVFLGFAHYWGKSRKGIDARPGATIK